MLADAASVHDGKLYIHGGGVTRLNAVSLPLQANLALVIRLRASEQDFGKSHALKIDITDPDGSFLVPPQELQFGADEPVGVVPDEEIFLNMPPLGLTVQFPRAGTYTVNVVIGTAERHMALPVVALTAEQLEELQANAGPQPPMVPPAAQQNRAARRAKQPPRRRN